MQPPLPCCQIWQTELGRGTVCRGHGSISCQDPSPLLFAVIPPRSEHEPRPPAVRGAGRETRARRNFFAPPRHTLTLACCSSCSVCSCICARLSASFAWPARDGSVTRALCRPDGPLPRPPAPRTGRVELPGRLGGALQPGGVEVAPFVLGGRRRRGVPVGGGRRRQGGPGRGAAAVQPEEPRHWSERTRSRRRCRRCYCAGAAPPLASAHWGAPPEAAHAAKRRLAPAGAVTLPPPSLCLSLRTGPVGGGEEGSDWRAEEKGAGTRGLPDGRGRGSSRVERGGASPSNGSVGGVAKEEPPRGGHGGRGSGRAGPRRPRQVPIGERGLWGRGGWGPQPLDYRIFPITVFPPVPYFFAYKLPSIQWEATDPRVGWGGGGERSTSITVFFQLPYFFKYRIC